jgi:hypothetical protein
MVPVRDPTESCQKVLELANLIKGALFEKCLQVKTTVSRAQKIPQSPPAK